MARTRRRGTAGDEPERGILDERRRLIAAGCLVAAVIAIVILGGILHTSEPPPGDRSPASLPEPPAGSSPRDEPVAVSRVTEETAEPESRLEPEPPPAKPPPPPPARTDSLVGRAASDRDRLRATGAGFTVQLMVACDADNARRNLEEAGSSSRLYLLPVTLQGRSCYRLCWGAYADRRAADRASDLPSSLRSRFNGGQVRVVAEVLR